MQSQPHCKWERRLIVAQPAAEQVYSTSRGARSRGGRRCRPPEPHSTRCSWYSTSPGQMAQVSPERGAAPDPPLPEGASRFEQVSMRFKAPLAVPFCGARSLRAARHLTAAAPPPRGLAAPVACAAQLGPTLPSP